MTQPGTMNLIAAARIATIALITLSIAGCARGNKEEYPAPPDTINLTADANARALQRAISLQRLTAVQSDAGSYRIGANDVIDIKVFEQPKMDLSTRVGGNGALNFPPIGDIRAAGMTERELETFIQDRLRGQYIADPHVSVFVREIQARMVGIIGAVNLPGQYSSFGRMRLSDVISKAGGLKPEAGDVAYVVRFKESPDSVADVEATSETIKIDLDGLLLRGEPGWNIGLGASDLVNIPAAGTVFITGNGIQKPGTYALTDNMTLQQLVDLAEGLKFEADEDLLLVRADQDGRREVFTVDYEELLSSRTEDIQLRNGDKVIVDRTAVKTAMAYVGRGLASVFRVLVTFNYRIAENNSEESD